MRKLSIFLILSLFVSVVFAQEKGSFTDSRDGKVYQTVKIGTQWWMTENLAYKASSGCWAYNNNSSNISKYGYLYSWDRAQKVCPSGWHLPSDAEWTQLTDYLGGEKIAGKKLKSENGWKLSEGENYGSNESGFTAFPGGGRSYNDGSFLAVGSLGMWWSGTQFGASNARSLLLVFDGYKVTRGNSSKSNCYSVRCVKDN